MKHTTWLSLFFLATLSCLIPLSVKAQVTPDGTTSTTVNQDGNNFTIEQGDRVGDNLFHSFNQFSVPTLGSAAFNNAGDIANIFSRVTGNSISNIDGLISANGAANLFLINPNGIIFGENASLNLGGSFFASTADSLLFEGNAEFSAVNPQATPLLEVSIPIGANFRDNPGDITVNQSILEVSPGKNLALVGGSLSIEGEGGELGLIAAPGGRIELGGLTEAGEVKINQNNSLTFPENAARGDVSLSNLALIDVTSDGEGSIAVNANNLELLGASSLEGGIASDSRNANAQAGDINLNATGEISLKQSSQVINRVNENAIGNSGDINIQTGSLTVLEESLFSLSAVGQGNAGDITINATDNLVFGEFTGAFSSVDIEGNSGNISVTANNISLTNGAQLITANFGQGDAGNIVVNASDNISLDGEAQDGTLSAFTTEIGLEAVGNAGDINVTAKNLSLTNGAQLTSLSSGQGNAGNIFVNASDSISLDGASQENFNTGLFTEVQQGVIGNAGKIEISTGSLTISNNANITSTSQGQGNAGNIFVNATDGINLSGDSSIDASIGLEGQGNAGEITINAGKNISLDGSSTGITSNSVFAVGTAKGITITGESLSLANGAFIDASNTLSQGAGGNIQIDVNDFLSLQNGAFIASNNSSSEGDAGDITIQAGGNITLEGSSPLAQSRISTATGGINLPGIIDTTGNTGEGGDIKIISNSLILKNYAQIFASTFGEGDAGNINIEVTDSVVGQGTSSFLSSLTEGAGNAGKIKINAGNRVAFDGAGSGINTGTLSEGQGSDIEITTSSLTLSNLASLLTSTNGGGNGGSIQVNASDSVVLNENSTLNSAASKDSTGEPGNIEVKTRSLLVNNDAQVTVESQGEGSGGNLFIEADSLTLDRNGSINASTISGTGGNITLLADILSLRNNSKIAAQALGDANGGNITTDADLIIAFPNQNNDIFANAAQGNGGNINITTQGIFGLEERPSTPPNQTNDIDASSEFGLQGTFSLNTPDVDPTTGLINLPASVGDASDQISQNPCQRGVGSEFLVTGKGGLPPNVNESLNSESAQVGLIETATSQPQAVEGNGDKPEGMASQRPNPSTTTEAVPAQGWVFNDQGEVTLTAYSTSDNKIQRAGQQQPSSCSSRIAP